MKRTKKLQAAWDFNDALKKVQHRSYGEERVAEEKQLIVDHITSFWPYDWPKSTPQSQIPPDPWTDLRTKYPQAFYSNEVLAAFQFKVPEATWHAMMMELLRRETDHRTSYFWFQDDTLASLNSVGLTQILREHAAEFAAEVKTVLKSHQTVLSGGVNLLQFICEHSEIRDQFSDQDLLGVFCKVLKDRASDDNITRAGLTVLRREIDFDMYVSFLEKFVCNTLITKD